MIVPTTILSLAALSAAESNSSRNRGLRKSSTPWTAIAVVSGTAITGVVIGGLIGWFAKGSGGAATACPKGTAGCVLYVPPKGCAVDYLLTAAESCTACDDGKPTSGAALEFSARDGTTPKPWEKKATGCSADGCRADFFQQTTANTCEPCPVGQYNDRNENGAATEASCRGCKPNYYQTAGNAAGEGGECKPCEEGKTRADNVDWVEFANADQCVTR